jgi:phosphatidylserine/phosphatidylglycerophosphate/cardiolipin synthase-like enzyme
MPNPKNSSNFAFYSRNEYFEELHRRILLLKKDEYIALATMSFAPEDYIIRRLIDDLCRAAKRGVKVELLVDSYSFLSGKGLIPGPLFYKSKPSSVNRVYAMRLKALRDLKEAGGKYEIINKPGKRFTLPFIGRSHIKFCVINDYVFLGGCNLSEGNSLDIMSGRIDKPLAKILRDFTRDVIAAKNVGKAFSYHDAMHALDSSTELYFDSGKKRQSIILEKAIELIDSAQEYVYLTCQFFPNDITIRRLAEAHKRGVEVKIFFNHPSKHKFPYRFLHHGVKWSQRRKNPRNFFLYQMPKTKDFLHAKLLATDKGIMLGSHNYVSAGVNFGTAEMSLFSTDPAFKKAALAKFDSL